MAKKIDKDAVLKIIDGFQIPVVTSKDYPPAWWMTDMGQMIKLEVSRQVGKIVSKINELTEY